MTATAPPCQTQSAKLLHQHVAFNFYAIGAVSPVSSTALLHKPKPSFMCVCPCNCFSFLLSSAEWLKSRKHKS